MNKTLKNTAREILYVADRDGVSDSIEKAIDVVYESSGKVVTVGIGKAGHVAKKVAATFMSIGVRSQFLHPVEALHGDMGCVDKTCDVALVFSNTGKSPEIVDFVTRLSLLCGDWVPVIIVSGGWNSNLLDSDVLIDIGMVDDRGFLPTASTSVMMAVGDAIAVGVMERAGFDRDDFLKLHPGGGIGKNG